MLLIDRTLALTLSIVAFSALGLVLIRYRTLLLGFSFMAFLNVAVASLSGFLFSASFELDTAWITPSHLWVFTYTALGLIAFALGVFLAWRPLARETIEYLTKNVTVPWLNPRFIQLCMGIGIVAQLLIPIALSIPTVRAAWSSYYQLLKIGVLIALVYSKTTRHYYPFIASLVFFVILVLFQAVLSGHIGAGGVFSLQLILVACFWTGLRWRSAIIFAMGLALITFLMIGWLSSRSIIRSGSLNDLGTVERSITFLQEFNYVGPSSVNTSAVLKNLRVRLDMSDILAAQAYFQPLYIPYAYGETVYKNLLAALVPRFLWANKPVSLGGSAFVSKYSGLSWGKETSIGLPYQFELYANGGALAVILGLFTIGWLVAKLELSLFNKNLSLPQFWGLLILTDGITSGSQTIAALVMQLVSGYIAVFTLGKVIEKMNTNWHFWVELPGRNPDIRRPKIMQSYSILNLRKL